MLHKAKKAIVTGAADGIGRATALRLCVEGAQVLAVDVNQAGLESLHAENSGIEILVQNVSTEHAAQVICEVALTKLSGIDFLINIAGVVTGPGSTIESQPLSDWQRVLNVNLNAVFSLCQQVIPTLKKSSRGRIINIGSIMSNLAGVGMGAYTASKHAIAGITKTLALELGSDGITANYILPGAIVTGITRPAMAADPAFETFWTNKSALGRMGLPEDIAAGINFLLSEDAAFITGHGLVIDGGVMQSA
jgi:NAD(P)-dependent dehydrogenase (short-subunit alcohol dehydrogenase family)